MIAKSSDIILDAFPVPAALLDQNGIIVASNGAWLRLIQASEGAPDGGLGQNYLRICKTPKIACAYNNDARIAIESVLQGKRKQFSQDYTFTLPTGNVWFNVSVTPLMTEQRGALLVYTNKTEQCRLSQSLQKAEEQLLQVFLGSPAPGLIISLVNLYVLEVNESFLSLFKYNRSGVVGRAIGELGLMPLISRNKWSQLPDWQEKEEQQVRTQSGVWRTTIVNIENIELKGQAAILMAFNDVTERKNIEEQLLQAINEVMQDASWFSHAILEKFAEAKTDLLVQPEPTELTRREQQVLALLATGMDNSDIADKLGIASQTVRNYVSKLYSKLNVNTRVEAVVWARERGFIDA